jgi:hypothetical protein
VPYGKDMAAVSNCYGFNLTRTSYTIDLVSTADDAKPSKNSDIINDPANWFLWGANLAAMV